MADFLPYLCICPILATPFPTLSSCTPPAPPAPWSLPRAPRSSLIPTLRPAANPRPLIPHTTSHPLHVTFHLTCNPLPCLLLPHVLLTCLPCLPLPAPLCCCPPRSPAVAPLLHSQLHCSPHSVKFTACGGQANCRDYWGGDTARQARLQTVSRCGGRWQRRRYCCQVLYPACPLRVSCPRRGTARLVRPT